MKKQTFDVAIIGGGIYGCMLALFLSKFNKNIIIIEKKDDILKGASYNNQARVHNGYHYPRSFLTAIRSHANFLKFSKDFKEAICDNYSMIYAIAKTSSKTTSMQFIKFCKHLGSPIFQLSSSQKKLFDRFLIEDSFLVEEFIFNAAIVRSLIKKLLHKSKVQVKYSSSVIKVNRRKDNLVAYLEDRKKITAKSIFNCAYSGINKILSNSNLPILGLKNEFAEIPLIKVPKSLKKTGITIMDGPFFGVLPFPDKKLHTIHHVRYTPHFWWIDTKKNRDKIDIPKNPQSNYLYMIKDAQRYIQVLKDATYEGSLFEIRTVVLEMENSDGRPILFRKNYGFKNFHIVLGGKIDNIYDIINMLQKGGL